MFSYKPIHFIVLKSFYSFENKHLIDLLFILTVINSTQDGQVLLVFWSLNFNHFVRSDLPFLFLQQWNIQLALCVLFKAINVIKLDFVQLGDEKCIHWTNDDSSWMIKVVFLDYWYKGMLVFPRVNCERFFTCGKSNTIPNPLTKEHLWTVHVVIHHILKSWQVTFKVNDIE